MFNVNKFFDSFNINIKALQESERITKGALGSLSRDVLEALHTEGKTQGDVQYINRLLDVLTPVNKRAAIAFFQAFAGFLFNEKENHFTKKDKQHYEEKRILAMANLQDDKWDIWVWQKDNLAVEAKPITLEKIAQTVKQMLKKADDNGLKRMDVLAAMMQGGIEADELINLLEAMDIVDVA